MIFPVLTTLLLRSLSAILAIKSSVLFWMAFVAASWSKTMASAYLASASAVTLARRSSAACLDASS